MDSLDKGELDTVAIGMHEMYLSFINAGFSEDQTMKFLVAQWSAMMSNASD